MLRYKQIIFFILIFFLYTVFSFSVISKETLSPLNEWGYTDSFYINEDSNIDNAEIEMKMQDLIFSIDENHLYFKKISLPISFKVENLDKFISDNQLPAQFSDTLKSVYDDQHVKIKYVQFTHDVLNSEFSHYLTINRQALYINDSLILFADNKFFIYAENYREKEFKILANNLASMALPIDTKLLNDDILSNRIMFDFGTKTKNVRKFLGIPFKSNDFSYLGVKLKSNFENVIPILITYNLDSGQEVNLFLFSNQYHLLDKLLLSSYQRQTMNDPASQNIHDDVNFSIDKNYQINIQYKYYNGYELFKRYQVLESGKVEEVPVHSSCYVSSSKEGYTNSTQSLLLTNVQVNNYLRVDDLSSIKNKPQIVWSLNMKDHQLCVDYLRAYSFIIKEVDSHQFFKNDAFYEQQVANFKRIGINISNKLQYLEFNDLNIDGLSDWFLDGNKAIYMNDKLFLVGKNFFIILNQPTKDELALEHDDSDD